ncbi:hypothetical protein LINPERPRIM_LOCUS39502 [Linum perenne]
MEGGRVKINCGMILLMVMLGMMVGQFDASFHQCLERSVLTCFFNTRCIIKCGIICAITDPPDIHGATNHQYCSLGCLATTLTRDRSTGAVLAELNKVGNEAVTEKLVERCSTACNNKQN